MVEINLESYILADSPKYTQFNVIDIPYVPPVPINITRFYHGLNKLYFDNLDNQYGIKFKYIWGYNDDNQYTQAYITDWDDEFLYVFVWSNQSPAITSQIKLTLVRAIPYVSSAPSEIVQVGELLIANTLIITQQFESLKKMDLRISTASFDLIESNSLKTFLGKYWTADKYPPVTGYNRAMGVHIKEDGIGKFFGIITPENITYDPESKVYTIDAFDWIKFLFETKGNNYLPDYRTPNLSEFLTDNLVIFNSFDINVNGIDEVWLQKDYNYILLDDEIISIEHLMTVEDMFIEIMKHYCGYLYYDGDKNLIFRHRSISQVVNNNGIDNNAVSGALEETYTIRDYDSLLINVFGDWKGINGIEGSYEGWALVWWEKDELQSLSVNADLSNIPVERKYLDLRQKIPFEDFRYRLFGKRNREEVYNDYAYLLYHQKQYKLDVNRTDLSLSNLVRFNGLDYIIRNIEILPDDKKSTLLMERKIG